MVRELSPQVVLVIQAHPDDADISSGGTIGKWAREGATITYVVCTSGEAGTSKPPLLPEQLGTVREQEEREAAKVLGAAEIVFLRHPDGGLHADHTLIGQLIELILRVRPTVVMTHDPASERNGHPDHWNAGQAALAAVLAALNQGYQVEQVLLFRSRDPNIAFDISESLDTKLAAIERHRTQRALGEAPPELVVRWAKEAGARWGMELAESFKKLSVTQCEAFINDQSLMSGVAGGTLHP